MWSRWGIDDIDMKSDGTCIVTWNGDRSGTGSR
ncbi:hypothetical protein Tco_0709481, partial [Tanacetum coccineum]